MKNPCRAIFPIVLLHCSSAPLMAQTAAHPECSFFRNQQYRLRPAGRLSSITEDVTRVRVPATSRAARTKESYPEGSIDAFIFADLAANGIASAPPTTDAEFIRRVGFDLVGRPPSSERVLAFLADSRADKRTRLIDELLARPEWVDKWTMYFGDLYRNTVNLPSLGINRVVDGRNQFYTWIRDSLHDGKPYDRMASELI